MAARHRPPAGGAAGGREDVQITVGPGFELDAELDSLRGKVSALRGLATAVGEESRATREHSEALEGALKQAKDAMRAASKRMDRLYRAGGGGNILLVVVLFALGVFLFVYVYSRLRSLLGGG